MRRKINVLLISLRSDQGGGPKYMLDLGKSLDRQKFELFTSSPNSPPFFSEYKEISKDHFVLPHRTFSVIYFLKLTLFCIKHNIQVVHSHGKGAGVYSRFLKVLGCRVIHTYHGFTLSSGYKFKMYCLFERVLSYLTDNLLCVSNSEKNRVVLSQASSFNKISVIYNGIERTKTLPKTSSSLLRVGTFCRFDPVKGLDIMIREFKVISEKCSLQIGGFGEDMDNLQRLANNNESIEFLGEIKDKDLFFQNIDIFCSFSKSEGMPLTVLEALAHKTPCYLSSIDAHKELKNNFQKEIILHDYDFSSIDKCLKNNLEFDLSKFNSNKLFNEVSNFYER